MRVVSLVPSLTETLFDLGAGDDVVGITDYCIFPEHLDRPRVGGTKNPHVDEIRALKPDLVYMNYEENLPKHAHAIQEFAPVHLTEPKTVDDVAALFVSSARSITAIRSRCSIGCKRPVRCRAASSRSPSRSGRSRGCGAAATPT